MVQHLILSCHRQEAALFLEMGVMAGCQFVAVDSKGAPV